MAQSTVRPRLKPFTGVVDLVDLLQVLTARPRFGEVPDGQLSRRSGRHSGIPMVCLVRDAEHGDLLVALRWYLHDARPTCIPHALYRFGEPDRQHDIEAIGEALVQVARQLSSGVNTRYGRFSFRRFHLVYWLMKQQLRAENADSDIELRRRLRERDLLRKRDRSLLERPIEDAVNQQTPWWARLFLTIAPSVLFRAKLRGLVPGAEYRWLLRQPYLAPHDPGTFLGFAERLTSTIGPANDQQLGEDSQQLIKLLVNAFLEDIRQAYRRRPWRLRPARRTAYPVILLDDITRDNGGYPLLKAINDVRNDTGAFDPLVIVSGSRKIPPDAEIPSEDGKANRPRPADEADKAYRAWCNKFGSDSRSRRRTAWYMPLHIPSCPAEGDRDDAPAVDHLVVRPAPAWSRGWLLAIVVLLVIGIVGWFGYNVWMDRAQWRRDHCGLPPSDPNALHLTFIGNECVGVTAGMLPVSGPDTEKQKFNEVQSRILDQNNTVALSRKANENRPYATVAYVTSISDKPGSLTVNTERLMGIAAQQHRLLTRTGNDDPLIRVLLANAGSVMQHGDIVANTLKTMTAEDPTIVGVVGLALSRQKTADTINALARAGLPTIAATLSADGIGAGSPTYFQVSPSNDRQAAVAVQYIKTGLSGTGVTVVHSNDASDFYSSTLTVDIQRHARAAHMTADEVSYIPDGTDGGPKANDIANQVCDQANKQQGKVKVIFFAGRPEDFDKLLDGMRSGRCAAALPHVLAGDDVSRYVASADMRSRHPEIPFDYLSFAIGSPKCQGNTELNKILSQIFKDICAHGDPSLDGHAALAYDSLALIGHAMGKVKPVPLTPGSIWHMLSNVRDDDLFNGESGRIDFTTGQIPVNKFVAVLHFTGGDLKIPDNPKQLGACGKADTAQPDAPWCPR